MQGHDTSVQRKRTEEHIKFRHAQMVNKLSDYFYKEAEEYWLKLQQLLKAYMPPRQLRKNNLQEIIDFMLQQEDIFCGQYDKLYVAVSEVNKEAAGFIKEAESDIDKIKAGDSDEVTGPENINVRKSTAVNNEKEESNVKETKDGGHSGESSEPKNIKVPTAAACIIRRADPDVKEIKGENLGGKSVPKTIQEPELD